MNSQISNQKMEGKINRVPQENTTGILAISLMNIHLAWWNPSGLPVFQFFEGM